MKTKTQFANRILSFVLCFVMVMTILPSAPMHVHATEVSESAPVCTCAEACTAENANEYCDVCGIDYSACTGTDTAAAYEDAVTLPRFLYVGGVEVISEYNVGAVTSGTGWRYDTATATLYLTDGADIRYSSTTEDSLENGIYCSGGTLKVHASGTVSITGYGDGIRLPDGSLDLYAAEDANVTITGTSAGSEGINSTVNTNSIRFSGKGTVNVNASDGASYGMTAAGSIYIDGVTLNVRGASNYDDISGANVLIGQTEGAVVNCLGTTCSGIGGTLTQKLGIYNGSIVHLAEKTTEKSWLLGFHAKTIEIADSTVVMDGLTGAYSIYAMHGTSAVSGDSHILIRKMVSTEDGAYGLTVGYDPYQLTEEAGYYTRSDAAAEFTADGDITEIYIGYFELCTASHYRYHSNGDGTHYYGCSAACPVAIKGENEACGGTVTCKELAVCEICGATHGELLPHTPVADSYQDSGEGKHSYTCAVCGTVTEGHKWVDGICTDCKAVCAHDHHEDGVCTACGVVCTHESYENGECTVCGSACVHDFDSVGLCNICDLRKVWLKTSSWEEPTIFCSDTSLEIPMTKDTETGLWYGYVPKTLEGFIFRRLYTNPYSGETFYHQTEQLSLPEDANSYRVKGSTSTDKDETYTYYTYDGNWYLHPCTEHTWESGECSKCGLVCSHTGGEATCTSQAICETCGSGYGEKLAHNFYDYTGRCWVCNEFLAVLQETRGGASTYYTLDQIASGKTFGYGGTLTLHANIRMEAGVSLGLGLSDFILDLNGYRLFAVDTHAVKVAGNLTILDSSADGGGYLEGYNIDSRDSTTSAVYGEGNNFHVTVLGDVKLFGVKTFLSGKSSDDVSGGVFDLTQWNHVAGSTIYITHETSTVYDSVLLPTGYALVDTDALVVWPGATVKENKALTVTECTTHAGGTASCAEQAKCEICGASYGQLDPDNHSINAEGDKPATCKDKAYCSVCKSEYGELDADNHASEEFTYIANEDGTTHKKMHKCCGKTASEAEPHTFDVTTGKCTACGTKRPAVVVAAPVANEKKIRFNGEDLPDGLMYNGGDQELIVPGTAEGGTMVYSLDLNGEFTETVPTAKDAGTYTVYYKVLGDETHADTDVASVTITMEKAPAIMSPTEQTHCMYYDCSDLPTGMRNCDLPNYDGYAIPDPNVDLIYTTNAVQGVEGEYTIFISGPAEDKNYIYTYENGTLILTDHIFNSFTGKCECGEEMAVASTTVDNITIYYLTVQEALDAAAQAESAVVELLRSDENVTGLTMFSGNVRLVMNGWTLKGNVNNNGILQLFGAELTVDGGTIENTAQDGYGVYAAYNDDTHRYSTISLIGSDIIGINAGICTYKAHVEVADSTVTGTEYGIHAQKSGAVTLESGTISGKIGVQTSIYGGTLYMGAEGTSSGPTINGQTYGVYHMSHMYAYAGTINCPAGIGVLLSEHHTNQNESEGAGLYLMGLPTINAATDIYVDYLANQRDKRCIQVYVELPEGAYSVDSTNEYEVIAIPGEGIKLNRTWFTSVDENKFVQYNDLGYLYLGPCAHGEKRGVQNEDDLTHDIWCDICLTTPEEDVACSGGTATCTSQAICEVCGELYGTKNADNHTGALGTPKPTADGAKHVATWSCCGAIGETEDHTMDTATGKCVCGLETAVASTTVGGTGTYYETLADAIAAAAVGTEDVPATVMVLKNIDVTETIDVVSGVFTLNLNGKTLRDYEDNGLMHGIFHLPNDSTAYMTIADTEGGKLLADWGAIEIEDGTVTITGGEFNYTGNGLGDAVSIDGGTLNISGGTIYGISAHFGGIVNISGGSISSINLLEHITVHISGGSIENLTVDYADSDVKLSGGAFERIDCHENTVSKLLADGYSYWTQDGTTMLNPAEDQEISDVIVKVTCYHPAEKLTYVTCDSSTHTWLCSDCNNNIIETHTAEPTYAPTADGTKHVATYTCCGGIGETEDHSMNTATGKCVCGLEMAVAKVTSGGVDTYYETLMEALTVAGNGDTVTLCKSVDIDTTRHTIPEGVTFQGGEYTVSSEDASWVENNGTIASGKFTFIVENNGMVVGGEFRTLINSGTVQGGSFESIDCDSGSSLLGPVSITGHLFYGGECTIDLSNATYGDRSFLANKTDSDLAVSSLKLPEGYAVEYDGAVVSVLPAWETGNIVSHTHTYETVFSSTHHWTQCACGKTTAEVEHSYTYSNDGRSTHTVGCTGCTYTDTQSHTYLADTHKCICGNVEKFMVTWSNGDGGSYEKEYAFGTVITVPTSEIFQETVRKTGYHLTGWEGYTEGMTMPAEALTFTAQYTPIEYTITWEMNGCTYELSNYHQLPKKLAYNVDSYQHNVNFFHITPPSGYAFVCFVDGNGNELETNSSDLYRLLLTVSGDMTVKAVIEPETYMATWTTGDGDNYEKEFKYGETITIPDNEFFRDTFRKTGYTLTGWEGYTEGMTMPVDGITFTAIYQANEYTITFDTDGGSAVAPITQAYGTQIVAPAAPAKDGSHFVKWENLPETVPAGDLTVKAVWEAHYGGEATCVSGKLCQVCTAEYTAVDANAHGALLYTVSQDGATCTVSCSLCQKVLETLTLLKPACKTYGDGKSCEVAVLVNDVLVTDISDQVYFRWENGQWNKLEAAPTNAGTYRAEIYNVGDPYDTADDFTLYVEYTIAKAKLTITAEDNTITYGDAPAANGVTGNGFVGSDSFTDLSGELTYSYNYEQFGNVGTYKITPAGLTSDNYAITFADGTLTVNAKAITVKADDLSKVYGEADPKLTYKVEGLVNGDQLTGELKRAAGENVGAYAITLGTLANSNYAITFTGAELTVTKRDVTITAKDQSITYGETISGAEITATGLLDGHSATVTLTPSTANVTVNGTITAGAAVITVDGTDVTDNYNVSYTSGKLVIEPDTSKIDALTTDNVTSANEEDIKAVQTMMASAETDGVDETTAAEWAAITVKCKELSKKIEAVEAENARIADAVSEFDLATVKSSDETAISQLISDIDDQLATNNLTDEEKSELEGLKTKCNNLIAKIDGTETLIGQLDKTVDDLDAETVKSTDKATLEQVIEDAQTLIDSGNVTEAEKEALVKTQEDAKALTKVIDDTASENKELTDQAATFDEDTVKSTDKENLEQLAKDIEDLLDTDNLTEDEREVLETILEQVAGMIDTIEDTAEDSKDAAEIIDALDPATVTSADKEELEQTIETIDKLLTADHLTEDDRKALEDAKAVAEALIERIKAAQDATDTENTEKVEDVTADNVKPKDREALEDAKADLEKALKDNAGNYTEAEKKTIRDEIQRIEGTIEVLENVEDLTEAIITLPDTVEPDDEETAQKILDTKEAYDELTDHEKSLLGETAKDKLDALVAALTAYDIIKGDGGKWTRDSDGSLSFTANGSFSKFTGIKVDGKIVDAKHYAAKSGSTIVILKSSYLETLSSGVHAIVILYTNGETSGTFQIEEKEIEPGQPTEPDMPTEPEETRPAETEPESSSPATGDDSNIMLYGSMFAMSFAAIVVLLLTFRKRKQNCT